MDYAIEGFTLEKSFAKKRSLKQLLTEPFRPSERVHALRGVDLHVKTGEIFGLLGPNGAGRRRSSRSSRASSSPMPAAPSIGGSDVRQEDKVKSQLGLVHSDERSFYWRLTGRENLRFFARLYDVPGNRIDSRIDELLRKVRSPRRRAAAVLRLFVGDEASGWRSRARSSTTRRSSLWMSRHGAWIPRRRCPCAPHPRRAQGARREDGAPRDPQSCARPRRCAIGSRSSWRERVRQVGTIAEVRRWGIDEHQFRLEVGNWRDGIAWPVPRRHVRERQRHAARRRRARRGARPRRRAEVR